ncbi:MAG: hypothetical protein D6738_03935, partial [Acidobacteria bacterium]
IDCVDPLPIRALSRTDLGDPTLPDQVTLVDPRPAAGSPLLTTDRLAPNDGFFSPASGVRGAFTGAERWADGWTNTARLGYFPTCNPGAGIQSLPNEARNLHFVDGSKSLLAWSSPRGDDWRTFDLMRSSAADDFSTPTCVENADYDLKGTDASVPAAGTAFFYLVRANNDCGSGSAGTEWSGSDRNAGSCL